MASPGTELHDILKAMGFGINTAGCGCQSMINKMNAWGPKGCREHRDEIIAHLEQQADAASIIDKIKAGAFAIAHGMPLSIAGLVDHAIDQAEAKGPDISTGWIPYGQGSS